MRFALSFLLLPALLPLALADDKEAEKLYRAMEKKIKAAKAVQITVAIEVSPIKTRENKSKPKDKVMKGKGSLLLTKDNKARLKISGDFETFECLEMVSNGKRMKLASDFGEAKSIDQAKAQPTPKKFHDLLSTLVSELGVELTAGVVPLLFKPMLLKSGGGEIQIGLDDMMTSPRDFKIGATETVGGRDAKVVRYKLGEGDKDAFRITVWIDGKTLLPLQRVIVWERLIKPIKQTEIYTEFKLDPKIEARAFELISAPDNEAEKVFRAMEAKINAAKAVQVIFDMDMKGKDREGKYKGSLLFTKDNKARLKMTGKERGEKVTRAMISDGKQLEEEVLPESFDLATEKATPKDLHRRLSTMVSRPGLRGYAYSLINDALETVPNDVMSLMLSNDVMFLFRVTDFKAGAAEKVGGRDAKVVTYNATIMTQHVGRYKITVWIDVKTLLPLKRLIIAEGLRERITEIYKFKLNPKVDAKTFELPR